MIFIAPQESKITDAEMRLIEDGKKDILDPNFKTPSQRLRAVLFLDWKQNTDQTSSATHYYENKMEQIINHIKDKLQ